MTAVYEPVPALLSLAVAILGCVSAFALATQLGRSSPHRWQKVLALANSGLTLGAAIWSTNFLAMTAVKFPALASHELVDAVSAIGIAVVAAWIGLYLAGSRALSIVSFPAGGVLVGLGIAGVHYRAIWYMPGCDSPCDRHAATIAVGIVLAASIVALWIALRRHSAWMLLAGGVVQGLAIVLMSYAAMTGIYVVPLDVAADRSTLLLSEHVAPYAIACGSLSASAGSFALLALISKDSMTCEQITLVQESFKTVEQNGARAGDLFYQRLFELAPEVRAFFPKDLTNQKGKVLAVLAGAVLNLHRLEQVLPVVRDLGRRHVNYGVTPDHYKPVGEALLWTLERVLGKDFTPATKAAWAAAYKMLASVMMAAAAEVAPETRGAARRIFRRRAA